MAQHCRARQQQAAASLSSKDLVCREASRRSSWRHPEKTLVPKTFPMPPRQTPRSPPAALAAEASAHCAGWCCPDYVVWSSGLNSSDSVGLSGTPPATFGRLGEKCWGHGGPTTGLVGGSTPRQKPAPAWPHVTCKHARLGSDEGRSNDQRLFSRGSVDGGSGSVHPGWACFSCVYTSCLIVSMHALLLHGSKL